MDTKVCNACKNTLPKDIFRFGKCKPCINKVIREKHAIRKSDPEYRERRNRNARNTKLRNPRTNDMRRKEWLKYNYNLTPEQYKEILDKQNGVCAICYKKCKTTRDLGIDHDHKCCSAGKSCGKCIRGLLCANCNGAIGMLQEDLVILNRAIEYLS